MRGFENSQKIYVDRKRFLWAFLDKESKSFIIKRANCGNKNGLLMELHNVWSKNQDKIKENYAQKTNVHVIEEYQKYINKN